MLPKQHGCFGKDWVSSVVDSILAVFLRRGLSAGVTTCLTFTTSSLHAHHTMGVETCLSCFGGAAPHRALGQASAIGARVPASDWWVLKHHGRMRLQVKAVGTGSLPYPWTLEGSTQALPRIQQIFKRWAGAQITLAAAAQNVNTLRSHQKLGFNALFANNGLSTLTLASTSVRNFSTSPAQLRQGLMIHP